MSLTKAASLLGFPEYTVHDWADQARNARLNLSARGSHWADPATLRGFRSRVLSATWDSLWFAVVESVPNPSTGRRYRRALVWDITGREVFRSEWYTTSAPAEKAAKEIVMAIDWETHTRAALQRIISERLSTIAHASAELIP
jgi:hypothetical protein